MKNRIQQFRKALKLSQRQLADIVGTSQQQIQRLESGQVTAKLEMATKLSSALQKPMDVVFPGSMRALKSVNDEVNVQHVFPDKSLRRLRESGIEGDPREWTFKVLLKGHEEAMLFKIMPSEYDRLYRRIQDYCCEPGFMSFVVFDTEDRRWALNLSELDFCHFLFEVFTFETIGYCDASSGGEQDTVNIHLIQRESPITLDVDSDELGDDGIGQCGKMLFLLEKDPQPSDYFQITDVDGEEAFIKAGAIALLSVPFSVLEPVDIDDEELELI